MMLSSAPAFKCNGYRFKSSLTGYLGEGSVHWRGSPACECTGESTLGDSVKYGRMYTGGANFFKWSLKLTNYKQPKVTCLLRH